MQCSQVSIQSPLVKLAGTLNATMSNLVGVLNSLKEQEIIS